MGSVNKAILVGNLGRDAEFTTTSGGFPIARFSLATTHRRKDSRSQQWEDRTEWHRIVLLGNQAESLRDYLRKGRQIYVEGRIETRSWDDKDGQKRYMTEIIADRIQLLGSPGGDRDRGASSPRPARAADDVAFPAGPEVESQVGPDDDDVPF
jgi:single-strand DNA-binding protein